MTSMTQPRRAVKPVHGVARLTVAINGTTYSVKPIAPEDPDMIKAFRLRKSDGTTYDVVTSVFGHECTCPDFVWRRDSIDPRGCKHVRALVACGMLDEAEACDDRYASADDWPDWTDADHWEPATTHEDRGEAVVFNKPQRQPQRAPEAAGTAAPKNDMAKTRKAFEDALEANRQRNRELDAQKRPNGRKGGGQ